MQLLRFTPVGFRLHSRSVGCLGAFAVTRKLCWERVNIAWESCGQIVHARGANQFIHGSNYRFPQLRRKIHSTPLGEFSSRASAHEDFHESTALITTTSCIALLLFDCFCESFCACENHRYFLMRRHIASKSSDRRISTAPKLPVSLYLAQKRVQYVSGLIQRGKAT